MFNKEEKGTDVLPELGVENLVLALDKYEAKVMRDELKSAGVKHQVALKLFDILRSSRANESNSLRKIAVDRGIIKYHRAANHLREFVMRVLRARIPSHTTPEAVVWHVQSEAMVCWNKGYREEAIATIRKGIGQLKLEDHPEHVLTLLVAEERMIRSSDFNKRDKRHAIYRSERNAALKVIKNREAINDLSEQAFHLRKLYHSATHPEVESKVRAIIDHPLLQNEMAVLSFTAKIRFHVTLSVCYSMLQDKELTLRHHKLLQTAWEERPDQQMLKPRTYQQAIINNISVHIRFNEVEQIQQWYDQASSIEIKDKAEAAAGFYALSNVWLFYLINNGSMADGVDFATKVEAGMEYFKEYLDDQTLTGLRFNLADLFFLSDDPKGAMRMFLQVSNSKDTQRKDLKGIAKMMVMLLSFNRNSSKYVDSMNKEARRYFRNNPEVDTLNGLVYETIGKLLSTPDNESIAVLEKLKQNLSDLATQNGQIAGLDEVKVWLQSKLTGKSYGTVWAEGVE